MALLIIPTILFGGKADKQTEWNLEGQADYDLRVKDNLISLKAKGASIKEILEDIGRRMEIEVVADIPSEEKITVELDMMYLGHAIKRFRTNYAYITESEEEEGKITKIIVVPKGLGMEPIIPKKKSVVKEEKSRVGSEMRARKDVRIGKPLRSEPSTYNYDSRSSLQKGEVQEEKKLVDSGIGARETSETEMASNAEPSKSGLEQSGYDYNPQPSLEEQPEDDYNPQPSLQ
jgi:hypothetical protein